MANHYRGGELLTGVLVGIGVGAAAALLFAPQSGQETREVIRERGLEIKSRAADVGEESRKRAEDLGDQARNRVEQAQARGGVAPGEQLAHDVGHGRHAGGASASAGPLGDRRATYPLAERNRPGQGNLREKARRIVGAFVSRARRDMRQSIGW